MGAVVSRVAWKGLAKSLGKLVGRGVIEGAAFFATNEILEKLINAHKEVKEISIPVVGLRDAGKTTILSRLNIGKIDTAMPTLGFQVETIVYKNIKFASWDVGQESQDKFRASWESFLDHALGLIFVVDSNKRESISKARDELHRMLNEDKLRESTLLVFANKQDLPNAMTVKEITDKLGLDSLGQRRWHIQASGFSNDQELKDGLKWLTDNI